MTRILSVALGLAVTTGCIVIDRSDDTYDDDTVVIEVVNAIPEVLDAYAGCYWDDWYADDIWVFEALVDDYDGQDDVIAVWADVWDEWTGDYNESFELYPTTERGIWASDWLGSSTSLSCWNPNYTVDFVVYDSWEDYSVLTVWADTY